jgi:hypothetical protein
MSQFETMCTVSSVILILIVSGALMNAQETCSGLAHLNNEHCSSNTACTCLPFPDGINRQNGGMCVLPRTTCSELTPCDSHFNCAQPNTICLKYVQCYTHPICYPLSMIAPDICPPRPMSRKY